MNAIIPYIESHWVQIGLSWLAIQNVLKSIQDAIDALPKDKPIPILTKIVLVMNSVSQYIFLGNRPTTTGGTK